MFIFCIIYFSCLRNYYFFFWFVSLEIGIFLENEKLLLKHEFTLVYSATNSYPGLNIKD